MHSTRVTTRDTFSKTLAQTSRLRGSFCRDETGATAVEYALLVGLIAIAMFSAVQLLSAGINTQIAKTACAVQGGSWESTTESCTT